MKRQLLICAGLTVVAMLCAHPAAAGVNILQNAGFEDGVLDPWYLDNDFGGDEAWNVTNADAHSGMFSATNVGNMSIRQDFAAVATADILELSFWLRQPEIVISAIDFFYSDNTSEEFLVFLSTDGWEFFDVTNELDIGKELTGFAVFGYLGGGELEDRTYIDDAQVSVVPAPGVFALLTIASVATRRRRRSP